jgi:hypothetical protein
MLIRNTAGKVKMKTSKRKDGFVFKTHGDFKPPSFAIFSSTNYSNLYKIVCPLPGASSKEDYPADKHDSKLNCKSR